MPNQAARTETTINGTQINPAFCSHISFVCAPLTQVWASPPTAPNTPAVITKGTTNCTTDTPRLPRPAFKPSAPPFCAFGKKKLIFDMLEAKLPPPKPHNNASVRKVAYGVSGFCTANPIPIAGKSNDAVDIAVQRRPPKIGTMNE